MCIGAQKAPQSIAPPAPAPTPTPTDINPVASATDRAKRLQALQLGLASTIKTSPGQTGQGADLVAPATTGINKTGQ